MKANFGPISTREALFPNHHGDAGGAEDWSTTGTERLFPDTSDIIPDSIPFMQNNASHAAHSQQVIGLHLLPASPDDELSGHLVSRVIHRSNPVVRVLFYGGHTSASLPASAYQSSSGSSLVSSDRSLCAIVVVSREGEKLYGTCSPSHSREGACVAEVTLPAAWWASPYSSSLPTSKSAGGATTASKPSTGPPGSTKASTASVEYLLAESTISCQDLAGRSISPTDHLMRSFTLLPTSLPFPPVDVGEVSLSGSVKESFEEVTSDDMVKILIPNDSPVYPNSKSYLPVLFKPNPNVPISAFSIRVKIKSGVRVIGAQLYPNSNWQIAIDISPKQNAATVTAYLRDEDFVQQMNDNHGKEGSEGEVRYRNHHHHHRDHQHQHHRRKSAQQPPPATASPLLPASEVFSWLFQVDDHADHIADAGRLVWQIMYIPSHPNLSVDHKKADFLSPEFDRDQSSKLTSKIVIQKDEMASVIGITRVRQLINTAILTGRQNSQPLRVFVVSQSGREGDVTLQATCSSTDESVIKVSPSCTSVYLDGSEIRGSTNASIIIKYGNLLGSASFVVWMPKFPLDITLSDSKLSQIKSWRTLAHHHSKSRNHFLSRMTRSTNVNSNPDPNCRLRYQQSYIQVVAKFSSTDHESGRESYLLSRRISFQVTDLVIPFLRLTDASIAFLRENIIEGTSPGRTEIQVISPITGRILGSKEIRMTSDKETITRLQVNLVSGIKLHVSPADGFDDIFAARVSIGHQLTSQYQEGILDVKVHFSDGTFTSLSDMSEKDYDLGIDVFENKAIAYAPTTGLPYPRIIALNEGNDQLIHVSLEVPQACQKKRTQQLAMKYLTLNVDFSKSITQSDLHPSSSSSAKKSSRPSVLKQVLLFSSRSKSLPSSSSSRSIDSVNQDRLDRSNPNDSSHGLTPLEIGMYAILTVFSFAVFIFVTSCLIFAVRFKTGKDDVMDPVGCLPPSSSYSSTDHFMDHDYRNQMGYPHHHHNHPFLSPPNHHHQEDELMDERPAVPIRTTSQVSRNLMHHHQGRGSDGMRESGRKSERVRQPSYQVEETRAAEAAADSDWIWMGRTSDMRSLEQDDPLLIPSNPPNLMFDPMSSSSKKQKKRLESEKGCSESINSSTRLLSSSSLSTQEPSSPTGSSVSASVFSNSSSDASLAKVIDLMSRSRQIPHLTSQDTLSGKEDHEDNVSRNEGPDVRSESKKSRQQSSGSNNMSGRSSCSSSSNTTSSNIQENRLSPTMRETTDEERGADPVANEDKPVVPEHADVRKCNKGPANKEMQMHPRQGELQERQKRRCNDRLCRGSDQRIWRQQQDYEWKDFPDEHYDSHEEDLNQSHKLKKRGSV